MAWRRAIERADGPSALLLSRQVLEPMKRSAEQESRIARGGYVLSEAEMPLAVVLIATGSEVGIAMQAQTLLAEAGIGARVVSMPCTQIFDRQDCNWRHGVLPPGIPRVAVEAGHPDFWRKYVGLEGAVIGLAEFGESAPGPALFEHFSINAASVAEAARVRVRGLAGGRGDQLESQLMLSIQ